MHETQQSTNEASRRQRRLDQIRAALADPNADVRAAAVRALERAERFEDLDRLLEQLKSDTVKERIEAVYGLGGIGDEASIRPLVGALHDSVEDVRAAAVRTLAELLDESTLSPIVQCLDDPSTLVKREAVEALGRFGDRRLVPILRALLGGDGGDAELIGPLLRALGSCRDERSEPEIAEYIAHADPSVRAAAIEALGQLD